MAYFGRLFCSKVLVRSLSTCTSHIKGSVTAPLAKLPFKPRFIHENLSSYLHINARYCSSKNISNQNGEKINIDEEMLRYDYEEYEENTETEEIEEEEKEKLPLFLTERGVNGVFDLDQLVQTLKHTHMKDICVLSVPKEFNYCDQLVLATGKSFRLLSAASELIRVQYKRKRNQKDPKSIQVEGLRSKNWLAIDLGNIVLHLFLEDARKQFNLEELWSVGAEFDDQFQTHEDVSDFSLTDTSFEEELIKFRNSKTMTD